MKEKVKKLIVSGNDSYLVWSEDLQNTVRDTELIVQPGCLAIYVVNGNVKSNNIPGRSVIRSKEEDKHGEDLQLICCNTDKTFDVLCGVGNVPFKDYDMDLETVVGAHGECKMRVRNPWNLFCAIGHSNISKDELSAYVKPKLAEIMTARLSETLQKYDYNNIMTQQSVIAEDLKKRFDASLSEFGLEMVNFAMAGIRFPEEYIEERKAYLENAKQRKEEKEQRKIREREQKAEIDNVVALVNATKDMPTAPTSQPAAPAAPQNNNNGQSAQFCPRCGMKVAADSSFCPGCGKKLN